MNLKKIISCLCLIPTLLGGAFGVDAKAKDVEQPVRLAAYSHDNLYNGEIYDDFEEYEIIENDDGFVINAYQTYERDDLSEVDGLDIPSGDYVRVKYVETYIESETLITIDTLIEENEQPIIDQIEGLVAENDNQQVDIIVGDEEQVFWLSDVVQEDPFNDVGFWSDFVLWLKGVGTAIKNVIVKGMRLACKIAVNIITLNNAAKLLSMYEDSYGNYHADFNCWQQYAGYNNLYDFIFGLGSSMKPCQSRFKIQQDFSDKIIEFNIWAWKGDYWELGAGAELGFYKRFGTTGLWYVDKKLAIDMKMKVEYYTSNRWITIVDWDPKDYFGNSDEKEWWITGFNPTYANTGITETNLRVTYTIKFVTKNYSSTFDAKLRNAFKEEWVDHEYDENHNHLWEYNDATREFSYIFE